MDTEPTTVAYCLPLPISSASRWISWLLLFCSILFALNILSFFGFEIAVVVVHAPGGPMSVSWQSFQLPLMEMLQTNPYDKMFMLVYVAAPLICLWGIRNNWRWALKAAMFYCLILGLLVFMEFASNFSDFIVGAWRIYHGATNVAYVRILDTGWTLSTAIVLLITANSAWRLNRERKMKSLVSAKADSAS